MRCGREIPPVTRVSDAVAPAGCGRGVGTHMPPDKCQVEARSPPASRGGTHFRGRHDEALQAGLVRMIGTSCVRNVEEVTSCRSGTAVDPPFLERIEANCVVGMSASLGPHPTPISAAWPSGIWWPDDLGTRTSLSFPPVVRGRLELAMQRFPTSVFRRSQTSEDPACGSNPPGASI